MRLAKGVQKSEASELLRCPEVGVLLYKQSPFTVQINPSVGSFRPFRSIPCLKQMVHHYTYFGYGALCRVLIQRRIHKENDRRNAQTQQHRPYKSQNFVFRRFI